MYAVSRRVRELSRGFTRDRSLAGGRYLNDPDLLGAYLLHFWPISYAQAALCLGMLRRVRGDLPIRSALDVGAGPGPMSLALLDAGAARVVACDRSGAALSLARRIAEARGYEISTTQWDATNSTRVPMGPFDVVVIGHTLNELWPGDPARIALRASLVERLGAKLAPGGRLLIIEPALKATAQEAIQVRDALARRGYIVEMPCIWQADCPALPEGTCHGEFDWTPPREMVRLAHMARIGRESLKMAWFVMRRGSAQSKDAAAESPDGGTYRVVSDALLSKSGRIRYLVCGPMGRFALSAAKNCAEPRVKPFFSLKRGAAVRFTGVERRETGWGLVETSRLDVVERPPRIT